MADVNQLQAAFLKAHDAGDKEGASFLAKQIRAAQSAPKQAAAERDIFQKLAGNDEDGGAQGREDFMRSMWHHASNLPLGAAQLAANVVGHGDGINEYMRNREDEYRSKIGDSGAANTGAVIGELATAALPMGAITKGVKAVSSAAKAVPVLGKTLSKLTGATGEGAVLGSMMPVVGEDADYWGNKGVQAASGAALQPVVKGVAAGAGKLIDGAARSLKPSAEAAELAQKMPGVKLPWWKATDGAGKGFVEGASAMPMTKTARQAAERDMFTNYNREMASRAIPTHMPVTDEAGNILRWEANQHNGKVGQDFVADARDQFDKAYGALYKGRTIPVDSEYTSGVRAMIDELRNYKPDLLPQVEGRINQIHNPIAGVKNFDEQVTPAIVDQMGIELKPGSVNQSGGHVGVNADHLKGYIASAYDEARALAGSQKHDAAEYLRQYARHLEDMRARGLPPEVAGEAQQVNNAFRNFAQYRQGMTNPAAQTAGMLTPQQHLRAINQNGRKYGGVNTAAAGELPNQADATLAARVMGSKIPDVGSGTGEKMFAMMGALNPKLLLADYGMSKMLGNGGLPKFLTGDTGVQNYLRNSPNLQNATSRVLRTAPGVIGGQLGAE